MLEIINPIHYADWNNLFGTIPQATIFHSSAWTKVLVNTYGYKPLYIRLIQGAFF